MILGLLLSIIPATVFAADADGIRRELETLKDEAERLRQERLELERRQQENDEETQSVIAQKRETDQHIKLVHDEIDNTNAQIQTYNQLIAQHQIELDNAVNEQKELTERYSTRIRAMEKNSHVSYWSVLFQSESFADFLSNIHMMAEIAEADQKMLEELETVARQIGDAQTLLAEEKAGLDEQRSALAESQRELETLSEQSSRLLAELNENAEELSALHEEYLDKEAELSAEIARTEREYNEANKPPVNNEDSDWRYPLPYRARITDAYGWRWHVITGKYSFHHGVDFAVPTGTAIYATRSGTVTKAADSEVYGFHVTINHGDGYSSLYAHMTRYVVSVGDEVKQGQIIGYVGSTGWSSGPHLHFSIYYRGNSVNPMDYV